MSACIRVFILLFNIISFSAFAQAPVITSFYPQSGTVGSTITITGNNFNANASSNIVYFGSVKASVLSATVSQLTVVVPAGTSYQPISVTANSLTAYSQKPFIITYNSNPFTTDSFNNRIDISSGIFVYGIAVKDLNSDGKPDIVVLNSGSNDISILKNNSAIGAVSFEVALRLPVNNYSVAAAIEDFNGDGKPDIVVTNYSENTITLFKNIGSNNQINFVKELTLATGTSPYNVAISDINLDGKPDIAVTNEYAYPGSVSVFQNTSSSTGILSFMPKKDFEVSTDPRGISIADLDADNKPEIIVACQDGHVSILKNTSTSTTVDFNPSINYSMPSSSTESVAIADLDGDSKPDITLSNNNTSGTITILKNTSFSGAISFATRQDLPASTNPFGITAGDIDGDGKNDVAVTNQLSNVVSVYINNSTSGTINLTSKVDFGTGEHPRNVIITDVDLDGRADLIVSNNNTDFISVFLSNRQNIKLPSVITLPLQQPNQRDANNNYNPEGTSTNTETPITYTSSNPAVATITPEGLVHLVGPGVSIITAHQSGNTHYTDALPATQILTVVEDLHLAMPPIATKVVCDADFTADVATSDPIVPITYSSSNAAVATISDQGIVHIVGPGSTIITAYQNSTSSLYNSAEPVSQTLNVEMPVVPSVSVTANYASPCAGAAVTFTATGTNYGANPIYQWKVNNVNVGTNNAVFTSSTVHNQDKVTCTLTNTDSDCQKTFPAVSNTIDVNLVIPAVLSVSIAASADEVLNGTPITFTATAFGSSETINYQWQVNGQNAGSNSKTFTSSTLTNGDVITCSIKINDICSMPASSEPLTVHLIKELVIPNTFTPNGDGVNDTWTISGILSYPGNILSVYNRYGELVYQARGYSNTWMGIYKGGSLPVATYYYTLDLGKHRAILSGWVAIMR
jgi:gliding motility-associated-like protein